MFISSSPALYFSLVWNRFRVVCARAGSHLFSCQLYARCVSGRMDGARIYQFYYTVVIVARSELSDANNRLLDRPRGFDNGGDDEGSMASCGRCGGNSGGRHHAVGRSGHNDFDDGSPSHPLYL